MGSRKKLDIEYLLNTPPDSPPRHKPRLSSSARGNRSGTSVVLSSAQVRSVSDSSRIKKPHGCTECGRAFKERGNLNKHILSVHEKQKLHQCERCNKRFSFRDGLLRHMNQVHGNERRFSCTICSQSFKQLTHLTKHVRCVHKKHPGQ